ncbi:MAG: hypothetical protein IKX20_07745 [Paludibacteraceae bacterium]|nr:hypothetical protein [Paludibacteraceae bacterium]
MTLRERLAELEGTRVKIGCGVNYIYCGHVYEGLEQHIDRIGSKERERLENELEKAQDAFDACERSYKDRIASYKISIQYEQGCIDILEKWIEYFEKSRKNAQWYMKNNYVTYWQNYFSREIKNFGEALHAIRRKKYAHEQTLRKNIDGLAYFSTPEAKRRYEAMLRERLEKALDEYESFVSLSDTEIREERMSIAPWNKGVRIILLKSSMMGRYWDEKECSGI